MNTVPTKTDNNPQLEYAGYPGRFLPDWSKTWTVEQAERELINFEFKGPGIYADGGDVMLVIPEGRPVDKLWHAKASDDEHFLFAIYNSCSFQDTIFAQMGTMPTRTS